MNYQNYLQKSITVIILYILTKVLLFRKKFFTFDKNVIYRWQKNKIFIIIILQDF